MKRFLNWLCRLFRRRPRRTRIMLGPAMHFVTTEDGTIIDGVTSVSCEFRPDGSRHIRVEIVEPASCDVITIRPVVGRPQKRRKMVVPKIVVD